MQCYSASSKSHQLTLTVSPIIASIAKWISERCCLTDVCKVWLTNQEKQLQKCWEIQVKWHWDLSGLSKNRHKLKLQPHLPEKFAFIAWMKAL